MYDKEISMGYHKEEASGLTDAQQKVLNAVAELGGATPHQLVASGLLAIGKVMIHRHLKTLTARGDLQRIGNPPKVYYQLPQKERARKKLDDLTDLPPEKRELLESFFAFNTGSKLAVGVEGFEEWFRTKQLPNLLRQKSKKHPFTDQLRKALRQSLDSYCQLRQELESQRVLPLELFDGTSRYQGIHADHFIDKVYYLDFYSLPTYGKTKLGCYVQKAKVGDRYSIKFIDRILERLGPIIDFFKSQDQAEAILWVPHSLPRPIGLMDELRKKLGHSYPEIKVMKTFPQEIIPQKSLSDLQARIENATTSNHILTPKAQLMTIKNALIVDDAIGSNATIHCLAKKLKRTSPQMTIQAIGIVGSYKGFDVIQDI